MNLPSRFLTSLILILSAFCMGDRAAAVTINDVSVKLEPIVDGFPYVAPGATGQISFLITNLATRQLSLTWDVAVTLPTGAKETLKEIMVLPAAGNKRIPMPDRYATKRGVVSFSWTLTDQDGRTLKLIDNLGVMTLPGPSTAHRPNFRFGWGTGLVHFVYEADEVTCMPLYAKLGCDIIRVGDKWAYSEYNGDASTANANNKYWTDAETTVNAASAQGMDLLYVMWGTPLNLYRKGFSNEAIIPQLATSVNADLTLMNRVRPPEPAAWTRRVTDTVTRFKTKVKFWEVWNDEDRYNDGSQHMPNGWVGNTNEYLELLREGSRIVKAADPSLTVLNGGFFSLTETAKHDLNPDMAERVVTEAADTFNITAGFDANAANLLGATADLRKKMSPNKPFWLTRVEQNSASPDELVRRLLGAKGSGASSFIWMWGLSFDSGWRGLLVKMSSWKTKDRVGNNIHSVVQMSPVGCAYSYAIGLLRNMAPTGRLVGVDGQWMFAFAEPAGPTQRQLLGVWRDDGKPDATVQVRVGTAAQCKMVDVYGNETPLANVNGMAGVPVTRFPAYLLVTGGDPLISSKPIGSPVITGQNTMPGVVGNALSYQITATNSPTSYSVVSLPAGLSLNSSTGLISGSPTSAGTFTSTIRATNAVGTGEAALVFAVPTLVAGVPSITSSLTKTASLGAPLSYQITATKTPTSYGFVSLPAGLSMNTTTGLISGTPTVSGKFSSTIRATNASGSGKAALSFTIQSALAGTPVISSALAKSGIAGTALSYQITASNSPTSYSASSLPAGLVVNTTTGLISGTPTVSGSFSSTISATNAIATGSAVLEFSIQAVGAGSPVITSSLTKGGTVSSAMSYQIIASNSPTSYNATTLPAGLTVSTPTGLISGTPTTSGTFNSTITATNASGSGSATLVFTIAAVPLGSPVINSALTQSGARGLPFSYQISASNSPTSYNATSLPAGLSVNTSTGLISGTPTACGVFAVTISAGNVTGTATAALVITLQNPFLNWKNRTFSTQQLANPAITGNMSTPANDGIPNMMKYALDLDPMKTSANGLPVGEVDDTGQGDFLTLTYTRVIAATDLQYIPEVSSDCRVWNSGEEFISELSATESVDGLTETVVVQDKTPQSLAGHRFMRLRVVITGSDLPEITSPFAAVAVAGSTFSYQITASNFPTDYGATSLPAGLTVNTSTGIISGSPSVSGTFNSTILATNSAGTGSATLTTTISAAASETLYDFSDTTNAALNGIHGGINFGNNKWWGGKTWLGMNLAAFIGSGSSQSFTLPTGKKLKSIKLSSANAGSTYTISDGVNTAITGTFAASAAPRVVTTGWTSGGATITLTFSNTGNTLIDDVVYD